MYKAHFLRRTKDNIFTIRCSETLGRELKLTELPLKTDLVIWLPLTAMQKKIYQYLIENQEANQAAQDRTIKAAFFVLSYIKKLCLHP
jgi:SNF2 family DNA or RNA helicase